MDAIAVLSEEVVQNHSMIANGGLAPTAQRMLIAEFLLALSVVLNRIVILLARSRPPRIFALLKRQTRPSEIDK